MRNFSRRLVAKPPKLPSVGLLINPSSNPFPPKSITLPACQALLGDVEVIVTMAIQ